MHYFAFFNPSLPEFFFSSFFGKQPKIGSIRLLTHRRDAHMNIFYDPFIFIIAILTMRGENVPLGSNGLIQTSFYSAPNFLKAW